MLERLSGRSLHLLVRLVASAVCNRLDQVRYSVRIFISIKQNLIAGLERFVAPGYERTRA